MDVDVPNSDGHTPVFAAITHCRLDCLKALALRGANLSRRDFAAGNTPAMVAASHGQTSCLCYLADEVGKQVLAERNYDGLSCACFAVLCGREETLAAIAATDSSLLLDSDPHGRSAPHYAASVGKVACLRIMAHAVSSSTVAVALEAAATQKSMAATTKLKNEALRFPVPAGNKRQVIHNREEQQQQRQHGLDPEHPFATCLDTNGESPLHAAARAGCSEAFEYLKNAGFVPSDVNVHGEDCLWLAAANNRVSCEMT